MGYAGLFEEAAYRAERCDLPLLCALIERYARDRPFEDAPVVFRHLDI